MATFFIIIGIVFVTTVLLAINKEHDNGNSRGSRRDNWKPRHSPQKHVYKWDW